MGLSTNFSFADHTNTFVNLPAQNTLLTTLNIFSDRQTSTSPKVSLDVIDEIAQKVASTVNRYGSEWSSIPKRTASNHLVESPLYAMQDRITAADVQPYRKIGSDLQATIMPLNDMQIRRAKPEDKPYTLGDGQGLSLLIEPNGSVSIPVKRPIHF